jgi:hypothetical protein
MSFLARKRADIFARAGAVADNPDCATPRDCLILILAIALALLKRSGK